VGRPEHREPGSNVPPNGELHRQVSPEATEGDLLLSATGARHSRRACAILVLGSVLGSVLDLAWKRRRDRATGSQEASPLH
jgi:hypothetical protein